MLDKLLRLVSVLEDSPAILSEALLDKLDKSVKELADKLPILCSILLDKLLIWLRYKPDVLVKASCMVLKLIDIDSDRLARFASDAVERLDN
ncbi:hypothetical protein SALWKB12_2054 [Snodgrassella communis]|nr:hypothetical protein SALWKB12_2054 [Snodgrassella communis]